MNDCLSCDGRIMGWCPFCVNYPPTNYAEEVYEKYTDTVWNLHWTGTHSGEHTVKAEDGE